MEWHLQFHQTGKKFKVQTSAGEVMVSIYWVSEGILLVEFLEVPQPILSEMCRHLS